MRFYLGSHQPHWLSITDVPLFVSHRRLAGRKSLPRARGPWALDSGGFSELTLYGEWRTSPTEYARSVDRYADEIGGLEWAAPQDWMCEDFILVKTGLTLQEHQRRTVRSLLELRERVTKAHVAPVLQGFTLDDYLRCVDLYERAGIDLTAEPVVGLGSICRRQGTREAEHIISVLAGMGLRLHGFGLKLQGLARTAHLLASADSMAWSYDARRNVPLPGCLHRNCANCLRYALRWRERVLGVIREAQERPRQLALACEEAS